MAAKIKVRLIQSTWIKAELRLLDSAEADRACKSKAKSVAVAQRLVRESMVVQAMPGADVVRYVSPVVLQVYKNTLRDVGENTFVFDEKTMKSVCSCLSAMTSSAVKGMK